MQSTLFAYSAKLERVERKNGHRMEPTDLQCTLISVVDPRKDIYKHASY